MNLPKDFTLPFLKKEQVAHDAYSFYFDRTKIPDFDFLPGQYVKMFLDVPNPDDRGTSRSFSIASSPLGKNYLMITTRIIQSAFKKTLAALTPGTQVKFFGPNGKFVFNEQETQPHIFLAGGIGITPFHSMFLYASEKNIQTPITLFVSFSIAEEVIFYDKLIGINTKHPNIKPIYTVTNSEDSSWQGETGRISEEMIRKYCPGFSNSLFYISGPPAMVDGMLEIVKNLNVPDDQVRKEKFVGY